MILEEDFKGNPGEKKLKKILSRNRLTTRLGGFFLFLGLLCFFVSMMLSVIPYALTQDFDGITASDKRVSFTAVMLTESFASSATDPERQYYFAFDEFRLACVICMDEENYDRCKEIISYTYSDSSEDPETVTFTGYGVAMDEDLTSLAILAYNQLSEGDTATAENAADLLGTMYLDTTISYRVSPATTLGLRISLFCLFISLIYLITSGFRNHRASRRLETLRKELQLHDVCADLSQRLRFEDPSAGCWCTSRYVISNRQGLSVLDYEDIIWLYTTERRFLGFCTIAYELTAATRQKRTHTLAVTAPGRKGQLAQQRLLRMIAQQCPEVMIGYNKENARIFRQV